jgi:putative transposase
MRVWYGVGQRHTRLTEGNQRRTVPVCNWHPVIWTEKLWAYLAIVLDLFATKPVGWAMSFSSDSRLTIKALEMAWEMSGKPTGVMFHCDQDSHYTSRQYRQLLWRYQIKQSMGRRGNCWERQ